MEGAVGDLVAGGSESCEGDGDVWMEAAEFVYDQLGLGQGEGGAAGAEAESG